MFFVLCVVGTEDVLFCVWWELEMFFVLCVVELKMFFVLCVLGTKYPNVRLTSNELFASWENKNSVAYRNALLPA